LTAWYLYIFYLHTGNDNVKYSLIIYVIPSAGIGRTGTFIALDYLMDQAAITGHVDVLECVETLRRQRVYMGQTKVGAVIEYLNYLPNVFYFGEKQSEKVKNI